MPPARILWDHFGRVGRFFRRVDDADDDGDVDCVGEMAPPRRGVKKS